MALNKELIDKIITVTSKAAISCHKFVGKNDKNNADKAATDAMRNEINKLKVNGEVVIGEGELDEAPMLFIGEKLGAGGDLNIDIAVDPLEGTNFVAKNLPGALSVISIAEKGNLFNAPETYMDKLAVTNKVPYEATDLDFPIEKNIKNIADSLNKDIKNISANKNSSSILQGFVEQSNVNPVGEISELLKTYRHFESLQRAIKTYDNIGGRAVNDIAKF